MKKNILIVAAHPDDEVLGCGGTIATLVDEGNDVYIAILGEGITSRSGNSEQGDKSAVEELHKSCRKAAEVLGAKRVQMHSLPDNRFDTVPLLDVVKIVEKLKDEFMPEVVYTHHHGDLNIDHRITFNAVLTACRPTSTQTVREIYSFEVPSSTEWAFPNAKDCFLPNVFVDVSPVFTRKVQALGAYTSEIRDYPHPRSPKAIEIIAKRWGVNIGLEMAEAFELVRCIRG